MKNNYFEITIFQSSFVFAPVFRQQAAVLVCVWCSVCVGFVVAGHGLVAKRTARVVDGGEQDFEEMQPCRVCA